jgi:hypothetical protein
VDYAFLMGVLDCLADLDEKSQSVTGTQLVLVAVVGDPDPTDKFHHKKWAAGLGSACVEHSSYIGVVHEGQGLPFSLKAGYNLLGVHAELNDFQRDLPPNRLLLFGHIHRAAPTLPDLLQ